MYSKMSQKYNIYLEANRICLYYYAPTPNVHSMHEIVHDNDIKVTRFTYQS